MTNRLLIPILIQTQSQLTNKISMIIMVIIFLNCIVYNQVQLKMEEGKDKQSEEISKVKNLKKNLMNKISTYLGNSNSNNLKASQGKVEMQSQQIAAKKNPEETKNNHYQKPSFFSKVRNTLNFTRQNKLIYLNKPSLTQDLSGLVLYFSQDIGQGRRNKKTIEFYQSFFSPIKNFQNKQVIRILVGMDYAQEVLQSLSGENKGQQQFINLANLIKRVKEESVILNFEFLLDKIVQKDKKKERNYKKIFELMKMLRYTFKIASQFVKYFEKECKDFPFSYEGDCQISCALSFNKKKSKNIPFEKLQVLAEVSEEQRCVVVCPRPIPIIGLKKSKLVKSPVSLFAIITDILTDSKINLENSCKGDNEDGMVGCAMMKLEKGGRVFINAVNWREINTKINEKNLFEYIQKTYTKEGFNQFKTQYEKQATQNGKIYHLQVQLVKIMISIVC